MLSNFHKRIKDHRQQRAEKAILYFSKGLTMSEISTILGVTTQTVRKYLLPEKESFLWIKHYYARGFSPQKIANKQKLPVSLVEEIIARFTTSSAYPVQASLLK